MKKITLTGQAAADAALAAGVPAELQHKKTHEWAQAGVMDVRLAASLSPERVRLIAPLGDLASVLLDPYQVSLGDSPAKMRKHLDRIEKDPHVWVDSMTMRGARALVDAIEEGRVSGD